MWNERGAREGKAEGAAVLFFLETEKEVGKGRPKISQKDDWETRPGEDWETTERGHGEDLERTRRGLEEDCERRRGLREQTAGDEGRTPMIEVDRSEAKRRHIRGPGGGEEGRSWGRGKGGGRRQSESERTKRKQWSERKTSPHDARTKARCPRASQRAPDSRRASSGGQRGRGHRRRRAGGARL